MKHIVFIAFSNNHNFDIILHDDLYFEYNVSNGTIYTSIDWVLRKIARLTVAVSIGPVVLLCSGAYWFSRMALTTQVAQVVVCVAPTRHVHTLYWVYNRQTNTNLHHTHSHFAIALLAHAAPEVRPSLSQRRRCSTRYA